MAWYSLGQCLKQESKENEAIAAWRRAIEIDPEYTPALFNLSRALDSTDPAEAARLNARFAAVLKKKRVLDQSETRANGAMASIQAHEWPEAEAGLKEAIQICGECASRADLHKKLGLVYCQAGDIDNGEKELRFAQASEPDDPDIRRALALIGQVRAGHAAPAAQ
jgi:tetratricopeptide (TPR) repeat protein